jgi:2'-5' RNA ligase
MRLFVGIPLPDKLSAEIAHLCARLRRANDGLRWTAPESWHITLQFLGNATESQFESVMKQLAGVRSQAVPIRLGNLGVFERAGVFLVKAEVSPELVALERKVVEATSHCGFIPENRPYQPHITLARAKADARRQLAGLKAGAQSAPHLPPFTADEFLLYESHLGPGGSKYEVRGRYGLAS